MQLSSGRKGEGLRILEYFADVLHKSLLRHIFSVLPLQMQADWNQKRQKYVFINNTNKTKNANKNAL